MGLPRGVGGPRVERSRIEQHHRLDTLAVESEQLRNTAPVPMPDHGVPIDPQSRHELAHVPGLRPGVQRRVMRLLGVARPEQVGRDHPEP